MPIRIAKLGKTLLDSRPHIRIRRRRPPLLCGVKRLLVTLLWTGPVMWKAGVYRRIPFNALSRLWGRLHRLELPRVLRSPALRLYIWLCGCRLEEALQENLVNYRNLSEFFRRPIKPHLRPIHPTSCLTSPADGQILSCGRVQAGHLEQVKGVTYTLRGFLGPPTWRRDQRQVASNSHNQSALTTPVRSFDEAAYHEAVKLSPGSCSELYHCVIYLAPGDYHRFHSAADWTVHSRRHFPGKLLSVNPRVASWVRGLFSLNERVVYTGQWEHGFFSETAVGATNVGSISVFCDHELKTNLAKQSKRFFDRPLFNPAQPTNTNNGSAFTFSRGELFGEFNLGSTIVLIFEAPSNFKFKMSPGSKVKMGETLGDM